MSLQERLGVVRPRAPGRQEFGALKVIYASTPAGNKSSLSAGADQARTRSACCTPGVPFRSATRAAGELAASEPPRVGELERGALAGGRRRDELARREVPGQHRIERGGRLADADSDREPPFRRLPEGARPDAETPPRRRRRVPPRRPRDVRRRLPSRSTTAKITNAVSRVSATTVRNRTIASAPTRLNARATFSPMTWVTTAIRIAEQDEGRDEARMVGLVPLVRRGVDDRDERRPRRTRPRAARAGPGTGSRSARRRRSVSQSGIRCRRVAAGSAIQAEAARRRCRYFERLRRREAERHDEILEERAASRAGYLSSSTRRSERTGDPAAHGRRRSSGPPPAASIRSSIVRRSGPSGRGRDERRTGGRRSATTGASARVRTRCWNQTASPMRAPPRPPPRTSRADASTGVRLFATRSPDPRLLLELDRGLGAVPPHAELPAAERLGSVEHVERGGVEVERVDDVRAVERGVCRTDRSRVVPRGPRRGRGEPGGVDEELELERAARCRPRSRNPGERGAADRRGFGQVSGSLPGQRVLSAPGFAASARISG